MVVLITVVKVACEGSSTVLYAYPQGNDLCEPGGSCPSYDRCDFTCAVKLAQQGDSILLAPGTYDVRSLPTGVFGPFSISAAVQNGVGSAILKNPNPGFELQETVVSGVQLVGTLNVVGRMRFVDCSFASAGATYKAGDQEETRAEGQEVLQTEDLAQVPALPPLRFNAGAQRNALELVRTTLGTGGPLADLIGSVPLSLSLRELALRKGTNSRVICTTPGDVTISNSTLSGVQLSDIVPISMNPTLTITGTKVQDTTDFIPLSTAFTKLAVTDSVFVGNRGSLFSPTPDTQMSLRNITIAYHSGATELISAFQGSSTWILDTANFINNTVDRLIRISSPSHTQSFDAKLLRITIDSNTLAKEAVKCSQVRQLTMTDSQFFHNSFPQGFLDVQASSAQIVGLRVESNNGSFFLSTPASTLLIRSTFTHNSFKSAVLFVNSSTAEMRDLVFQSNRDRRLIRVANSTVAFSQLHIDANRGGGALFEVAGSVVTLDSSLVTNNNGFATKSAVFEIQDLSSIVDVSNSVFSNNVGSSSIYVPLPFNCYQGSGLTFFNSSFLNNNGASEAKCLTDGQLCECSAAKQLCSSCTVLDRCAAGSSRCDPESTTCVNSGIGLYSCSCKPGFASSDINDYSCTPQTVLYLYFSSADADVPANLTTCLNRTCDLTYLLKSVTSGQISLKPGTYRVNIPLALQPTYLALTTAGKKGEVVLDFQGTGSLAFTSSSTASILTIGIQLDNMGPGAIKAKGPISLYFSDCTFSNSTLAGNIAESLISLESPNAGLIELSNCYVQGNRAPAAHFATATGNLTQIVVDATQFDHNVIGSLVYSVDGLFKVSNSQFRSNRVSVAHISRASQTAAFPTNSITNTRFQDGYGPLAVVFDAPLTIHSLLAVNNTVDSNALLHLSANFSLHILTISDALFSRSKGIAIGSTGLYAQNVTCLDSTDSCFHLLAARGNVGSSTSVISRSVVTGTRQSPEQCGMAIKITKRNSQLTVFNSTFDKNEGGLGLFCVNFTDDEKCSMGGNLLTIFQPIFRQNFLPHGCGEVFYAGPYVSSNCLPGIRTFGNHSVTTSSYPVKFLPETFAPVQFSAAEATNKSFSVTVAVVDVSDNPPPQGLGDYALCYTSDPQLKPLEASPLYPTSANLTLHFTLLSPLQAGTGNQSHVQPGVYSVAFGPDYCPELKPYALQQSANLTVTIGDAPQQHPQYQPSPTGAPVDQLLIGLLVPGSVIFVASVVVVSLILYLRSALRRKREPRLLSEAGLLQVETLTELLKEANLPLVDLDDLKLENTIGSGATGVVIRATWPRRGNLEVAVKQHSSASIQSDHWEDATKAQMEELITELKILIQLDHPNVLPLLAVSINGPTDIRLVSPYMANKSLAIHLASLENKHRILIARQIAWALEYLKTKSIIHRDLKPENVLLSENFSAFLSDFARSKASGAESIQNMRHLVGSAAYSAPEVIVNGIGDFPSDVYSYGVIVWELVMGRRAFSTELSATQVMLRISRGEVPTFPPSFKDSATRPGWIPEGFVELIERCLDPDPSARPTIKEVCDTLKSIETF